VEFRLGVVEFRLGAVEFRLGAVEFRLEAVEFRLGWWSSGWGGGVQVETRSIPGQ